MSKLNDLQHTKDPRGLVQRDLDTLKQVFKPLVIKPSTDTNTIMYHAGIDAVVDFIERKLVN